MNVIDLLEKGYFPKELPPCFYTSTFSSNYSNVMSDVLSSESSKKSAYIGAVTQIPGLTGTQKADEKRRREQIFKNRMAFSDPSIFNIPKAGLARNIVKIVNPIHQGKLSDVIASNYSTIELLFIDSNISTTKPEIETETSEGKRAIKHAGFINFKEQSILNSFNYAVQLKTDISKFYQSIYTHSVPWVTFGGKANYKRNRDLHKSDPSRVHVIYGDDIDNCLMWCQNQQTMGIPIGPDTSFIIGEIIACHIDKLLQQLLQKKRIDYKAFRFYDDFLVYTKNELDSQIVLAELKKVLADFELKINDQKTFISKTQAELERVWALSIKSFYFRPTKYDQRDDIWNFFAMAFKFSSDFPDENVLKLALNKFNFVRVERENWDFFESLLYRLGIIDTISLQKIARLLVTYKEIVNTSKLRDFCNELIERNFENENDFELTWSLWLMNQFNIQPVKEQFEKIFQSKCVCACIIALDLLSKNNRIKKFDYSAITALITTENLNTRYWLLTYEAIFNNWIPGLTNQIVNDHFYFEILQSKGINFYDAGRKLSPLKVDYTYLFKIERKLRQIINYLSKNNFDNEEISKKIDKISKDLDLNSLTALNNREEVLKKLSKSDSAIQKLIQKTEELKQGMQNFEKKKKYFVIGKRLEELGDLTSKELSKEENTNLLFDPSYDS